MTVRGTSIGGLVAIRRQMSASELAFILLAVIVGAGAGLAGVAIGAGARTMQHALYALVPGSRLSATPMLGWPMLAALPIGGPALALFSLATRARRRRLVDAVEANALHGGRMSVTDSLVIAGQTMLSNGFGASIGLEAAYAQIGSALSSVAGGWLWLRRGDVRIPVGAGTGAAIAGAFGAPLAGAFYTFEIVLGACIPASVAPVVAAALTGTFAAQAFGTRPYALQEAPGGRAVETRMQIGFCAS